MLQTEGEAEYESALKINVIYRLVLFTRNYAKEATHFVTLKTLILAKTITKQLSNQFACIEKSFTTSKLSEFVEINIQPISRQHKRRSYAAFTNRLSRNDNRKREGETDRKRS